jgi:hypothetical protein
VNGGGKNEIGRITVYQLAMDIAEEIWNIVVKTWLTKAHNRRLIKDEEFEHFMKDLDTIGIKLNNYINSPGKKHNDNK